MEYCGGRGEAPACGVFCEATRARRRSNGGCGEAPACCVIAVVTARQHARGPDSVVFALSDGVWWGKRHYGDRSCIAVAFLVWCGLFSSTSYRHRIVFRRRLFGQEKVGSRVILACSATVPLHFLSFTRVDTSIQPGEG